MDNPIWQLEDVCLQGATRRRIDAATLVIGPGVTAITGASGAGKTSLLHLLVGFEQPDTGRLGFHVPDNGQCTPLFWSPQDGGLWPHLSVREHLEAVIPSDNRDRVHQLLEVFDLASRSDAHPDHLSQGQRSRLSVARALISDARVLVLDEPLAHVDPARIPQFWQAIRDHLRNSGATLVFATHSPQTVLAEAQNVVCLGAGHVLYHGDVETLYWRPEKYELATCLGEVNWLPPKDAAIWLMSGTHKGVCYRPEQISIKPSENSPIIVQSSLFRGSVAEAQVTHEQLDLARRFVHRPSSHRLRAGQRVAIRACALVLLLLLTLGCGQSSAPPLPVREVNYWSMPPAGPKVPAPRSVATGENGEVIVLDNAGRVLIFNAAGQLLRHWWMPDFEIGRPEGVCLLKDNRIAVADTHYHRVIFFDQQGKVLSMLSGDQDPEHRLNTVHPGTGPGQFIYPVTITQDNRENLYVAEYGSNDRVQKFSPHGQWLLAFGSFGTGAGQFQRPSGMAWHDGKIYVADAINHRIQVFSDDGAFLGILDDDGRPLVLKFPYDLALGPKQLLYVVEYGSGRVTAITITGHLVGRYGRPGGGAGQFSTPWGLAIDDHKRLRIADTGNRRIVELKL